MNVDMTNLPMTPVMLPFMVMNPAAITVITLITAALSLYLYFLQPSLILQAYFRIAVRWSGMKMKMTKPLPDGFHFSYGEKGHKVKGKMSMVFLHGFTADHFMWAPIIQNISASHHVIAVDFPGHGFTMEPLHGEEVSLESIVRRLKQFFELVGLTEPVHLVGVSMGGAVGGLFAGDFPHLVGALSACCPSMKTPEEGYIFKVNKQTVLRDGILTIHNCPMLPQTAEQVQKMLNFCHFFSVSYPSQILQGVADLRKKRNNFYVNLVNVLVSEHGRGLLEENLAKIVCPSQVIWGKEDLVVDVSGAEVLRHKLPNCQRVDIISQCGHAVNLDQPQKFADLILDFWQDCQRNQCREK